MKCINFSPTKKQCAGWKNLIFVSKSFWTIVFVFVVFFHISAAVSSGLPQVSPVYLDIEMIQPGKSFLKLIKQSVQEIWRSFINNDVIVFHAYLRKHYKKFDEMIFICKSFQTIVFILKKKNNNKDENNSLKTFIDKNHLVMLLG